MPVDKLDDAVLMERIADGDERAFAQLFHRYGNRVGYTVQFLINDREACSEIVQDVFAKLWLNRQSLASIRNLNAYLHVLCRNHTLNHIRKVVAERKLHESYCREVSLVEYPVENDGQDDRHELVQEAIAHLPPQQRTVVMLRQQGMKNPEISRQMNLSVESVKKYHHLAVKAIGRFLRLQSSIHWMLLSFLIF